MKYYWTIVVCAVLIGSCKESTTSPAGNSFNIKFSYGVGAKNVLNTYDNTYTKDLVVDSTITVPFYLSGSDLH